MGGGNSSSTKSTSWGIKNGYESQSPWTPQEPYLLNAFQQAQSQYDKNMKEGAYAGDYVAGSTDQQRAQGSAVFAGADQSQGYNDRFLQSAQDVMGQGRNWMGDSAGTLADLSRDQTGNIINNANQYRAGFDVDAATKAATAAAYRNAAESTVPNLYRSAAGAGGLNSSRAALAQGVVDRGLGENAQNIHSNLNNSLYQFGVGQASNDLGRMLQSSTALGTLGANAYNMGQAGINNGINNQGKIDTRRMAAADYLQALNQNDLNNQIMKYTNRQNFGWGNLANYYNIIGNRSWGGNRVYQENTIGGEESTTKQNPSALSTAGSMLGMAGSLVGSGNGGGGGLIGGFRSLFSPS
jgi:hypothetical protein